MQVPESILAILTLSDNSTVEIKGEGELTDAMIEPYIDNITHVEIGEACTSIGNNAFYESSLSSITIPNNVVSMATNAFSGCKSLTSVTIPSSITRVESWLFENCYNLNSLTIPNSIEYIGSQFIYNCYNLEEITYIGTIEEWNNIEKDEDVWSAAHAAVIHCTNGDVNIE